jgi:hypothetical protein
MKILEVPKKFQPKYKANYPPYSNGFNMEEMFCSLFTRNKDNIQTDYIYIPIFWTSFYILRQYGQNIKDLLEYLDKLDKSKKYFTTVQYAGGIFMKKLNLNMVVFAGGGGGMNLKSQAYRKVKILNNPNRVIFVGKKGDYDLPLICAPQLKAPEVPKTIFCSFMGRFDTHNCRLDMQKILRSDKRIKMVGPSNWNNYRDFLNQSEFALCPRGHGYTSFRLFEAMAMNCIPVYIWEEKKVLPFSDEIKWNEFCIIIHTKDMKKIPEMLNNISVEKKQQMVEKIKEYNKMFTFEGSFEYIKRKMNKLN